ncbi:MAG: amidase [Anaerolineales bacterium]
MEKTISQYQQEMSAGKLSSRELVQFFLQRIQRLDEKTINAVIELNPEAEKISAMLDEERRRGKTRGALHGIPVLVKDNIDTHDQMQTTAGSLALEGNFAPRDAFIVKRLRQAGAVILGKTNLSEWANFRGRRSVSGWSSRGGLTRNPYALDRSACGSSSGSAAAAAANFCAAAVGTETDGSVICPSQTNGVVGIKPTLGLLSRSGIIPIAHSQDTAGAMARTVADAAILLGAMTGMDERDPATKAGAKRAEKDYAKFLDADGLRGARIGVPRKMCGSDPRILHLFEQSLDAMRNLGAVVIDAELPNFDKFGASELEVLHYEFKADLNRYLASSKSMYKTMEEIIRFNEENRARVMPYFGQEHMLAAQEKGSLRDEAYRKALAKCRLLTRKNGIDAVMQKRKLDALVVPSGGPAWLIDLANGDAINWDMESTSPAAVAGYPHITVPMGYVFGLPVGLSFFSRAWQEGTLIKLAYAFEQATQVRVPPKFLKMAKF